MKVQIPLPDIKSLSAYLDGQLTSREGERLEARLDNEPDLQVALTELRRTRNLLRSAPRLWAPRNFTLTPEMVGERRGLGFRLYPTFRLASAIASLLFVAVVAGDFFSGSTRFATGLDQAAPQVALLQEKEVALQENIVEAPAAEMEAMAPEEMPVEAAEEMSLDAAAPEAFSLEAEVVTAPDVDTGDITNGISSTFTPVASEPVGGLVESMKAAEEQVGAGEEAPLMEEVPAQEEVAPGRAPDRETAECETVVSTVQAPLDRAMDGEVDEGSQEDVFIPLAAEFGDTVETAPQVSEPGPARGIRPQWSFLHISEVLLGVLALGMGGLAYFYRRRA